ncbi:MAG TPA: hypothetical protein VMV59_00875 [Candidatus Dormibacteraeota bacterium]|nr:hypothetical protein [Candidatus Dormibacteraeota bacterium]
MATASYQKPEANSTPKITVSLRLAPKAGSVLAWADVTIQFARSRLEIWGLRVLQSEPTKPAWIAYPQTRGKEAGRFYHVVRASGALHDAISFAVLAEFEKAKRPSAPGPERARIPGDDDIPF